MELELLQNEITRHGDQAVVIPIHRLQDIRLDLEELKGREELNNFQQFILSSLYALHVPDTGFEVRSILLVASPAPAIVELVFTRSGRRIPVLLPASYVDKETAPVRVEGYLKALLTSMGYQVQYAPQLPRKRLAVRSGLAAYGRNNICYVEGMGSFLNFSPFFSDLPCQEDHWQPVRQMDACHTCHACLRSCPTGAILPNRFLIDNERCLPYFNEAGAEWDFPAWIDPSAHNTLYGCLRCQTICPANKAYAGSHLEPVDFTEEETALLIEGKPFDAFPPELRQKVESLQMNEYLRALPRNMRVLFERV